MGVNGSNAQQVKIPSRISWTLTEIRPDSETPVTPELRILNSAFSSFQPGGQDRLKVRAIRFFGNDLGVGFSKTGLV